MIKIDKTIKDFNNNFTKLKNNKDNINKICKAYTIVKPLSDNINKNITNLRKNISIEEQNLNNFEGNNLSQSKNKKFNKLFRFSNTIFNI